MPKLKIAGRACLAVLFFSLSYAPPIKAEDSSKDVQFISRILTVNEGLPPGVESIAQTQDGYMWFATQDGLARFDGAQFRIFDKNNTPGIHQNYITVLLADQARGTLWIGTYGGGLTRYQAGTFKSYTTSDGLPGNFIFELAQGPAQELLIGTDKGLAVFKNEKIEQVQLPGEALNKRVAPITASPDGSAWFLYEGAIYRMDKERKISKPEFQVSDANTIYADREANIWVGTRTHGLYEWSGGKTTHYSNASSLAQPPIRAIYQDHKGKIWVEIYKAGLCQPRAGGTFDCYTSKDGLPESNVTAIYEDHEGNLWLAAEEYGVIRLRVNNFFTQDERRGLSNNNVLSIHESNDGTLWVGSRPGLTRIQDGRITTIKIASTVPGSAVSAIAEAGNGDLWLGTQEGLKLLHGGKVIRSFTTQDGWASNSVTALFRDHQGNLWMGNRAGGLTRYAHGKFTRLTQKDGLLSTWVSSVMEDHEGSVWFSTAQGVTRFKDGEFNNIPLAADEKGVSTGVNCMYEDDEHVFWLGTYGSGLVHFSNGKFVSFRQKDGLLDDTLWSIVEDGSRNLWMSSNRGLFRVSKSSLEDFAAGRTARISSTVYGVADGLPTTDFNGGDQAMGLRTREGKLVFATSRGAVEVDPGHLRTNPLAPPVVIEESLINQMQAPDQASVPVGRGELEFHFAGLSFVEPSRVVFKYKLEGFDKDWISAGGRHTAYYTNIPPGKYQFRVMAANNDGVWNKEGAVFNLYLKPHFYQTLWFDLVCVLGLLLSGGWAYQFRIRHMRKREEDLVIQVNDRTRELQQEIIERNRATEKAEAATRAKGEFLASMSHEIRTPLNGVMGSLDLAAQTQVMAEQKELLQMCRSSADALLVVLNDILDFSKIEAGKLQFEEAEFQLPEILAKAARTVAVSAHQKKLELTYFMDADVPPCLLGDSSRLNQIFMNLLGNAVKFTDKGEVLLRVQAEWHYVDRVLLRFSVSDTGIGIPRDKQNAIFEAFSQADTSVTRRFGGTGLGLAICARIVSLIGGRMWVESTPGQGSTFYFTASFKTGKNSETSVSSHVSGVLHGRRVLIVDDSQSSGRILEQVLQGQGMEVAYAASGAEGLRILKEAQSEGRPVDILIADCDMPEMDGFMLVQEAGKVQKPAPKTIMMITSVDYPVTAARCRQMKIEASLIKPIGQSELLAAITGLLQVTEPVRPSSAAAAGELVQPGMQLRVLLAEDNLINQKLAVKMLEKIGHKVTVVDNGLAAVEQVQNGRGFDLVFMDVHMPEMDGYTATQAIRRWEKERGRGDHIPIIAMTANAMAGDRDKCLEQGMDEYVAKPIDSTNIVRVLEQISSVVQEKREREYLLEQSTSHTT